MPDDLIECAEPECGATHKNHRWGFIKAENWFHQKDGTAWCPEHHPEWVASWRAQQKTRTDDDDA